MTYRPIKYPIKDGLFKVIDEQWKAYFLGWMYSDGNMDKEARCMCLNINTSDREILDYFVTKIYPDGRPLYNKRPLRNKIGDGKPFISQPQLRFYVSSKPACLDMIRHGLVPKKSLILRFPKESTISNALFPHFLRGYFEGDGYITANDRGKCYSIGILGTIHLLEGVRRKLEELDIKSTIRPRATVFVLNIARINDIVKFFNLIYQDAEFYLKRKRAVFDLINSNRHASYSRKHVYKFVGVSYSKLWKGFVARVVIEGKRRTLGRFDTQEEAHEARLSLLRSQGQFYVEPQLT